MQLAKVIGDVVCTRKDDNLSALTLLIIQPLAADGQAVGRALVAADSVGAGVGETVFFVRGKEASFPFYPVEAPVDAGVVGIVDQVHVPDDSVPERRLPKTDVPASDAPEKDVSKKDVPDRVPSALRQIR
jgi:ethanolamine utilization protein EutN